jgi:hypothetical protein
MEISAISPDLFVRSRLAVVRRPSQSDVLTTLAVIAPHIDTAGATLEVHEKPAGGLPLKHPFTERRYITTVPGIVFLQSAAFPCDLATIASASFGYSSAASYHRYRPAERWRTLWVRLFWVG